MAQWQKNFTQIDNVNSGNEVELTDAPKPQMFNVALNNTQYLYNLLNLGFISSITVSNGTITVTGKNASGTPSSITISIADLNGYTKTQVDNLLSPITTNVSNLQTRTTNLENNVNGLTSRVSTLENAKKYVHHFYLRINGSEGSSYNNNQFDIKICIDVINNSSYPVTTFAGDGSLKEYFDTYGGDFFIQTNGMMRNKSTGENWKPILEFKVNAGIIYIQYAGDVAVDEGNVHSFFYNLGYASFSILKDKVTSF